MWFGVERKWRDKIGEKIYKIMWKDKIMWEKKVNLESVCFERDGKERKRDERKWEDIDHFTCLEC